MSKIIDIESLTPTKNESKGSYARCEVDVSKIVAILIMSLFVVPFGITSVYYAYTDNSCANLRAGKLYVNLKDYLAVNGILYLLNFVLNTAIITYLHP